MGASFHLQRCSASRTTQLARCAAAVAAPGQDFNGFDRARFFVRHFNPALAALRQAQAQQRIPWVAAKRAVRADAGLERNTPTLLNAALPPNQFYDSRVHSRAGPCLGAG